MVINRDRHNKYSVDGYLSYSNTDSTTTTTQGTTDSSQQSSGSTGGGGGSTTIIYQGGSSKPAFNQVNVGQNAIVATNDLTAFGITGSGKIQVSLENNVITITYIEDEPTDQYWQVDEEGNLYTTRNVYSTQEISAYGLGEGGIPTGGASYLYELKDVDLSSLADQSILQYNNTTQKWEATDGSTIKPDLSDYATITYVDNKVNILSSTINAISQRVVSLEDMFEWDGDRIKAKADLYGVGEISAYGYAEGEIPTGAQYLSELKDVDLTNIANQGILQYNSNTRKWEVTDGSSIRPDLTGYATQSWVTSTLSSYATQAWVTTQINNLIGTAPDVLDTIYEIAAALNNDPDFVKDIANNLANLTNRVTVNETDIAALETNLDALTNRVVSLEDMFEWDNGKIKAKADLYGIGEIAAYGYSEGEQPTGAQYLHELKDVTLTDLAANQLLQWNGSKWVNINKDEVGLNESELAAYLTANNYVTESYITWDNIQNKPVSYQTEITKIIGLNSDWVNLLKTTPTDYVTRWPNWSEIGSKPTTLAGFGITDAYSKTDADGRYVNVSGDTMTGELIAPTLKANTRVQIGDAYLEYESSTRAIRVCYKDDTALVNLYATGEVSAYDFDGEATGFSVSLSDLTDVSLTDITSGQLLQWNGTKWINIDKNEVGLNESQLAEYLTDNQYAKKGDISIAGLTDLHSTWDALLKAAKPATLAGYGITDAYTKTDADGRYVLKAGDTITGNLSVMQIIMQNSNEINSNVANGMLYLAYRGTSGGVNLCNNNAPLTYGSARYSILHTGNFSSMLDGTYAKTDGTNVGSIENISVNRVWNIIPRVFDVRSTNRIPSTVNDKSVEFLFNNTGMPESDWYAAITVKGWTNGYSVWQLAGYSGAGSISRDLYYRVGIDATWDSWRKLLDTGNYTITLDSRYVKKSGDTMTGALTTIGLITTSPYIYFGDSSYSKGRIGLSTEEDKALIIQAADSGSIRIAGRNNSSLTDFNIKVSSHSVATINDQVIWTAGNDGSGSGLDADLLDGYHVASILKRGDINIATKATVNVEDYVKGEALTREAGNILSQNGWSWAQSAYIKLNDTYTVDRMRYSILSYRNGDLNRTWHQQALMFLPTYHENKEIYLVQMNTSATAGVVTKYVKRYTDYDTILASNVASATKLQTARTIWGQSFDGSANVSGSLTGVLNITMSGNINLTQSTAWIHGTKAIGITANGDNTYGVSIGTDGFRPCANAARTLSLGTSASPFGNAYFAGVINNTGYDSYGKSGFHVSYRATDSGTQGLELVGGNTVLGVGAHSNGIVYMWRGSSGGTTTTGKDYFMEFDGSQIYNNANLKVENYVYSNQGWFQNNKTGCGLYNTAQDARWYASGGAWNTDKPIIPKTNNNLSVGTSSYRFNYGYFTNLNLSGGLAVSGISTFSGTVTVNSDMLFNRAPIIQPGAGWIYFGDSTYVNGRIGKNPGTNDFWIQAMENVGSFHISGRNNTNTPEVIIKTPKLSVTNSSDIFTTQINSSGIVTTGEVTAYSTSDKRLKEHIQDFTALTVIRKMRPVQFDWTEEALSMKYRQVKHDYGLIAQEVEEYLPNVVEHDMYRKGYLGIDYTKLIPFALAGIKEVDSEVTRLKQRVEQLEQRLSKYESIV